MPNNLPAVSYETILIQRFSDEAGKAPTTLYTAEIAVNVVDKKMFIGGVDGVPFEFSLTSGSYLPLEGGTLTGSVFFNNHLAQNIILKSYSEHVEQGVLASGIVTIDCATANIFSVNHTENITDIALNNVPIMVLYSGTLYFWQDATGNKTITFPASWSFPVAPVFNLSPNAENRVAFSTYDGGDTCEAFVVGQPTGNQTNSVANFDTARTISATGDGTWSVLFDGSSDVTAAFTLSNSGVTAGTYSKVTVNAKGRVTAGSNIITADISDIGTYYQPINAKLTGFSALSNSQTGLIKITNGVVSFDTTGYLPLSGGTVTGGVNLGYNTLSEAKLTDYAELVGTATAVSNVITLSPSTGSIQTYTLVGNTTINPDTSAETTGNGARSISLYLTTGATIYTVTFSASLGFANTPPTFEANKTYEFSIRYISPSVGWMSYYVGKK